MCNFVGCLFALGYAHRWCVAKGQMEKVLNKYGKKKYSMPHTKVFAQVWKIHFVRKQQYLHKHKSTFCNKISFIRYGIEI